MDIEEFYDADPRRRSSPEVEFGTEWHDRDGARYEVSWVQDTGELYVMREPIAKIAWSDIFGDERVEPGPVKDETVAVVGELTTLDEVERALEGWQDAMGLPDGLAWLSDRLRQAGVPASRGGPGSTSTPG